MTLYNIKPSIPPATSTRVEFQLLEFAHIYQFHKENIYLTSHYQNRTGYIITFYISWTVVSPQ